MTTPEDQKDYNRAVKLVTSALRVNGSFYVSLPAKGELVEVIDDSPDQATPRFAVWLYGIDGQRKEMAHGPGPAFVVAYFLRLVGYRAVLEALGGGK